MGKARIKTRHTMIRVLDQAHGIGHDITHTSTHDTTNDDDDDERPTCGRKIMAVLRPSNPTINSHSHLRGFLSNSTSRSQGRTDFMEAHDQVSMAMSFHRVQSLANRFNHTVEIFSQLVDGSLPLERVVSKENHLCWRVHML